MALLSIVTEGVTILLDMKIVLLFRDSDDCVIVTILDPASAKEEVVFKTVLLGVAWVVLRDAREEKPVEIVVNVTLFSCADVACVVSILGTCALERDTVSLPIVPSV